jgi:hypothetical protein
VCSYYLSMLEEVEGEVLAFDQSTRMLILKG